MTEENLSASMTRLADTMREMLEKYGDVSSLSVSFKAHMDMDNYMFAQATKALEKLEVGMEKRHAENRKFSWGLIGGVLLLFATKILDFVHFGH